MRNKVFAFAFALVLSLTGLAALAAPAAEADMRRASAGLNQLAEPAPHVVAPQPGVDRTIDDLRDSAALVLIGSMLIGLAAAVRRTA